MSEALDTLNVIDTEINSVRSRIRRRTRIFSPLVDG
jgi:hypothetical protein